MDDSLSQKIINKLKELESDKTMGKIIEVFKGVPMGYLASQVSNPPAKDMNKAIKELFEQKKIKINGYYLDNGDNKDMVFRVFQLNQETKYYDFAVSLYKI